MRNLLSAPLLMIAAPALFAAPPTGYPQTEVTLKIAAGSLYGTLELPSGKGPFPSR